MQGIVLTSCESVDSLLASTRASAIPLLKVVTGWGAHWSDAHRAHVCASLPEVIVRTVSGDGTRPPPPDQSSIFLEPATVMAELEPWYRTRPRIWFELGNEPNAYDASDDAAWTFRYWFLEAIETLRKAYPCARIISPGLIENRQEDWWAICQDAFALADAIGVHAYAWHQFTTSDTGQLQRALSQLRSYYPNHTWMLTECGINDAGTPASTKATRYGQMHAKLPSQMMGACWYHYCSDPQDADMVAYALPDSALPYLHAGGTV
jgi:hypothetical protein